MINIEREVQKNVVVAKRKTKQIRKNENGNEEVHILSTRKPEKGKIKGSQRSKKMEKSNSKIEIV